MPRSETPAEAQRRFARDNDRIAGRLAAGGHGEIAAVYREAAREHERTAERIEGIPDHLI